MQESIRRIVTFKDGRTALIPKDSDNPEIQVLDAGGKILFTLGENEIYDGAKLSVAELDNVNLLSWGRNPYLKIWNRNGALIKKLNNRFFVRGVVILECGRFVAASGSYFIIYNLDGETIKIVTDVEENYICRIQYLYGDLFITSDLETPPIVWDREGKKIATLTECGTLEIMGVKKLNDDIHVICSDKPFSTTYSRPRRLQTRVVVYDGNLEPKLC